MRGQVFAISVPAAARRRWGALPCSVVVHAVGVAALVCIPLLSRSELPAAMKTEGDIFFVQPAALPPPPPPPARGGERPAVTNPPPIPERDGNLVAPTRVPDQLPPEEDPTALFGFGPGDPNGVEGGSPDGISGGIVGGLPVTQVTHQDTPVRVGGVVNAPAKLHDVAPEYPELARRIGLQGDVVLECVISREGRVTNITVVSGNPVLAMAARAAAEQWIYTPTLLNGIPVPVLLRATTHFRL
jgi:protein TonB